MVAFDRVIKYILSKYQWQSSSSWAVENVPALTVCIHPASVPELSVLTGKGVTNVSLEISPLSHNIWKKFGRPDFQPAYQTSTRAPPTPWQSVPRTYSSKPTFPPHTYSKLYILYIWFKLICKLHPPVLPARQTDFGHSVHCEGPAPCLWGHLAEKNFCEGKT